MDALLQRNPRKSYHSTGMVEGGLGAFPRADKAEAVNWDSCNGTEQTQGKDIGSIQICMKGGAEEASKHGAENNVVQNQDAPVDDMATQTVTSVPTELPPREAE